MIIQIYGPDSEKIGLFEVKKSEPPLSMEDAEKKITDAFIEAHQEIGEGDEVIDLADNILRKKTNGQISRIFLEELIVP